MEKIYLYYNNLDSPKVCLYCGKQVDFRNVYKGYDDYCGKFCAADNPTTRNKTLNTLWKKNNDPDILKFLGNDTYLCKCIEPNCDLCKEKQYEITRCLYVDRKKHDRPICPIAHPINNTGGSSQLEQSYQEFLETQGYNIIKNNRTALKGLEIDIYLPDYNLAIEINGNYWHSLQEKKDTEHILKWSLCNKSNIELITIWEDWGFELGCQLILDKINGKDLNIYKDLWFSDLKDNEWPLDLGYPKDHNTFHIHKHFCKHHNLLCSDSGVVTL